MQPALLPGASSSHQTLARALSSSGTPPLPKEERICHFWLTNPSHSLGPGSLDSTRQSHPSGEDGPRGGAHKKLVSKRKMRALITSGTRFGLNYSGSSH